MSTIIFEKIFDMYGQCVYKGCMEIETYKKIPAAIMRHSDKIQAIDYGSGFCTESGNAWDILLVPGWSAYGDCVHVVIEQTASEAAAILADAQPCNCEDCEKEKASETQVCH